MNEHGTLGVRSSRVSNGIQTRYNYETHKSLTHSSHIKFQIRGMKVSTYRETRFKSTACGRIYAYSTCYDNKKRFSDADTGFTLNHVVQGLEKIPKFTSKKKHLLSDSKILKLLYASTPVGISFATAYGDLIANHVFMCAFWSWLVAQVAKVFTAYYREGRWDYKVMFDSGGMPSSHTSLVFGLTTSIAHQYGLGSVYFPLALTFTLIVMYDAAGVRRHAGKQAEVLNKILADTFHGSPLSNTKLKEVLGHSPLQVVCGAILGVLVGTFYMIKFSY